MKKIKELKPIMYENSLVPVVLSRIAPINIGAISFGLWVWARGKMSDRTKRHETIHFQQQIELGFVGQWLLYGLFHLINLAIYKDGRKAYYENPFEREAYANDDFEDYLSSRPRYAWLKYVVVKDEDKQ